MSYLDALFSLNGKVALVTGSNRGIGYSLARGLALAGASVVLYGPFFVAQAVARDMAARAGFDNKHLLRAKRASASLHRASHGIQGAIKMMTRRWPPSSVSRTYELTGSHPDIFALTSTKPCLSAAVAVFGEARLLRWNKV